MKSINGAMRLDGRLGDRRAVWFMVIAALVLVSCTTSGEPSSTPAATPAGDGIIRVGIVESVEGDTLSVQTLDGLILVQLTGDSKILEFADGPFENLAVGQRVTVMGRETEAGVAARVVIVSLENTSLFQDQGDIQIGRGSRAFVGIIERIDDGSVVVSTKLGPRTATFVIGETVFQMPASASKEQLSTGQLVTVIGSESAGGGITARSVLITPDLGRLMSAGRTGGRRGQGRGPGSSSGAAPAVDPAFALDTEREAGTYDGIRFVVTGQSEATFRVQEQLALIPLPHYAELRTTALSGDIHLDGRPSVIEIDLHQLASNQRLRDQYVRRSMFPDHPTATFILEDVGALPNAFAAGEEVEGQIAGVLNIRGADFPLTFDVTAQDSGDAISIRARTKFTWDALGMSAPTVGLVLKLNDEVEVRITLTAKPVR